MAVLPTLVEGDLFDEAGYLRLHPGVRAAVAKGQFESGRMHFDRHGRTEGRRPNDVNPLFYMHTYPQVMEAFGPLLPAGCAVHYVAYGRARGYLPCAGVERAAVTPGLWTDAADALDRIDTKEAAGTLTDRQAAMLRSWWTNGLLVLDRPAPRDRLDPAALDIERIFAGACPDVTFNCPSLAQEPSAWTPELAPAPAAALDPHFVSVALRSVILDDPSKEFARLLLQGRPLLAASRGFIRPPVAVARRASTEFGCSVPGRFLTAWIALEDDVGLSVWKGSHRLPPPMAPPQRERVPGQPGARNKVPGFALQEASGERLEAALATSLRQAGKSAEVLRLERGTVVLLHPELVHACPPVPMLGSARAITAELCPEMLMPLYSEQVPTPLYRHAGGRFASAVFRDIEPLI